MSLTNQQRSSGCENGWIRNVSLRFAHCDIITYCAEIFNKHKYTCDWSWIHGWLKIKHFLLLSSRSSQHHIYHDKLDRTEKATNEAVLWLCYHTKIVIVVIHKDTMTISIVVKLALLGKVCGLESRRLHAYTMFSALDEEPMKPYTNRPTISQTMYLQAQYESYTWFSLMDIVKAFNIEY